MAWSIFLVYTTPWSDSRIHRIIDPYIKKGLVTQVHIDAPEYYGQNEYAPQQLVGNDCLYRMKHRTEWLMPFVDVDEYLNFNPGAVHKLSFPEGVSTLLRGAPGQLSTGLPRAVMSHAPRRNFVMRRAEISNYLQPRVNSISFGRVTFRHPKSPETELQLSSVFREAELADLCPKYMVRPLLVHTLFVHWPTSWAPFSKNLWVPPEQLVGHHYRTLDTNTTTTKDMSLQVEEPAPAMNLQRRFGSTWPSFAASLHTTYESSLNQIQPTSSSDLEVEVATKFADFVKYVNSLMVPTFIKPPGSH